MTAKIDWFLSQELTFNWLSKNKHHQHKDQNNDQMRILLSD